LLYRLVTYSLFVQNPESDDSVPSLGPAARPRERGDLDVPNPGHPSFSKLPRRIIKAFDWLVSKLTEQAGSSK
jgi:hypothetical protein